MQVPKFRWQQTREIKGTFLLHYHDNFYLARKKTINDINRNRVWILIGQRQLLGKRFWMRLCKCRDADICVFIPDTFRGGIAAGHYFVL